MHRLNVVSFIDDEFECLEYHVSFRGIGVDYDWLQIDSLQSTVQLQCARRSCSDELYNRWIDF